MGFQPHPQVLDLAIRLVGGDPGERHTSVDSARKHRHRLAWLGGEGDLVGYSSGLAPVSIGGPGLR
jgi:hypothetical protein